MFKRSGSLRAGLALWMMVGVIAIGAAQAESPPATTEISVAIEPSLATERQASPAQSSAPASGNALFAFSSEFPTEVEPNGTFATATPIGAGAYMQIQANILPAGDVDFYSFTANAGDRVYAAIITSASTSGNTDSQLNLLNTDGTTVLESDEDDGSLAAASSTIAGRVIPAAGTYYLRVNQFNNTNALRPYFVHFRLQSAAPTPEIEANDTSATANVLPAGGHVSGARNPAAATEQDWYSFTANAGDTIYLGLDADPERDNVQWDARIGLALFGDAGNQILVVNDASAGSATNPLSEAVAFSVKTTGTYFAFVDSASAAVGGPTATYNLSVSVQAPPTPLPSCTTYTSTDVPKTLGPGTGLVSSVITVPGNPRISDVDVDIVLNHALMADLDVHLRSPAGNDIGLFTDIGAAATGGQQQMDIVFDDEAPAPPTFTVLKGLRVKPEIAYRLNWLDGENAGGTWTLDLRDDTTGANGGSLTAWSLRICEAPPPPACAPGFVPTTVFTTDFESGAAGFTHSGTADEWELGLPATVATTTANPIADFTTCNSGVNCWKTDLDNTYNVSSIQDLLSPAVNLAGLSAPIVVRWAQRYQMESASFDHYSVDAQQVGGATPVRLYEWTGATMVDAPGNPVVNIGASAGWGVFEARADSLAGLNSELRFHLDSDTTVNLAGVAIDDVSVTGCRAASADLSITKTDGVTTAVPGGSVTYTVTASNAGVDGVTGATVADTFPASLTCTWTCVGAGGGTCTAAGAGNISDSVNLPTGGSVTYTASCAVSASATGTLSNTATVSSSVTDPIPGNNSATDTDTLTPQADLAITKTDGVTSVTAGGSTTYTITASNAGPSNATGATVADTFPASLTCTWTCVGAGGGTCTASGAGNINDTVNLPGGGSVTYTAACAISGAATGTLSNTATVTAPAGVNDPTPGNNSATDSDTIGASADLAITKTDGVTSVTAGGSTTYTITASNAGPSNATGATVADTFPASLTCTWACVGAGGGTCTASGAGNINGTVNLPSGGSVTYTASCAVSASATGTLSNTATVTAPAGVSDPTPGNNSATDSDTIGASANLAITKTDGVTSVTAGGSTTYTITASNAGPSNATGATVADTFPASLTCTWACVGAGGGTCTASGAGNINDTVNLPSAGSVTYTAACAISGAATGTLSNTATVTAPAGVNDPTPGNNSATDSDTVNPQGANVSGTKTVGGSFVPGSNVTYTVTLGNSGGAQADNPGNEFTDVLPAQLTLVSATASSGTAVANVGTNTVTWNGPITGSGGSVTITIIATIQPSATGTISNQGSITYDSDANGSNDASRLTDDPSTGAANDPTTFTVGGALADLAITKTDGVTSVTAGGSTTYTITASNAGPSNATGATVADTFPASLTCTWTCVGAGGGTCTASGAGNINGTVNLPSGGSVTYTAVCAISGTATGTLSNTATVTAPAGVNDPTPGNNSATDSDTIGASADLAITKTDGVTSVTAGGSTTYTITASNAGPSNATGATVADTFPASLTCTWTCVGAGGGTCTASGAGNINGTVNLPSGGSVTYTAVCAISGTATGTLSNTATVTAPAGVNDPTPGNNSATDSDTVNPQGANVSGTKTVGGSFVPGSNVTYTVTLSNSGGAQADNPGNEFTDVLPAQLTLVSAAASSGTAVANVGTNTVTWNGPIAGSGGSVTITIIATIQPSATGTISNQGSITYDSDANGTNDASAVTDDPAVGGGSDATRFTVGGASADLSITKTDGVTQVLAGNTLTYTLVAGNSGPSAVTAASVTDTMPAQCVAPTWTCSAAGGAACTTGGSGDIAQSVNLPVGGTATFTVSCPVAAATAAGTTISNTASIAVPAGAGDPDPSDNVATDTTSVIAGASLAASKSVSGAYVVGGTVTYTVALSNNGGAQTDNPGDEFTDVLPAQLTLVSASAGSGTAVANVGTNTVTWNGAIAGGGSLVITIVATIDAGTSGAVSNQASLSFDADANGTNESSALSDDPAVGGTSNPTVFVVAGAPPAAIQPVPSLGTFSMLLLMLGLILLGAPRLAVRRD